MLIDINDVNAWSYRVSFSEFDALEFSQIDDPITLLTPEVNSRSEEVRDRAYKAISPLLDFFV